MHVCICEYDNSARGVIIVKFHSNAVKKCSLSVSCHARIYLDSSINGPYVCALGNVFGWGQTWPRCKRCFLAYIFLHSNASQALSKCNTHKSFFSPQWTRSHTEFTMFWTRYNLHFYFGLAKCSVRASESVFQTSLNWYVFCTVFVGKCEKFIIRKSFRW